MDLGNHVPGRLAKMAPSVPQEMDDQELRSELGEILDRLSAIPSDAFSERAALLERQHKLRRALRQIETPGSKETTERWAERAASKPPGDKEDPVLPVLPERGGGICC